MKIAISLSGHLRSFENCFSNLENRILNHNNCDIYMQTYESPEIEKAISLYKPKSIIVENEDTVEDQVRSEESGPMIFHPWWNPRWPRSWRMFRNIQKSFSLIPSNQYDFVVRCRYDIEFEISLIFSMYSSDVYNIPCGGDSLGGITDCFAFSSYENMKWYSDVYSNMKKYKLEVGEHPETVLRHHLSQNPNNTGISRFKNTIYSSSRGNKFAHCD